MQFAITEQVLQHIPPQGQQILAKVDGYLEQVAAFGRRVTEVVLADADFIYLVNRLQFSNQPGGYCDWIDYHGIKLVRRSGQLIH